MKLDPNLNKKHIKNCTLSITILEKLILTITRNNYDHNKSKGLYEPTVATQLDFYASCLFSM